MSPCLSRPCVRGCSRFSAASSFSKCLTFTEHIMQSNSHIQDSSPSIPQISPRFPVPADASSAPSLHPQPPDAPDAPDAAPALSARQLAALDLLLAGHTETAISASLGIDRKTLYNW